MPTKLVGRGLMNARFGVAAPDARQRLRAHEFSRPPPAKSLPVLSAKTSHGFASVLPPGGGVGMSVANDLGTVSKESDFKESD